jgi:hypothetical protein
MLMLKLDEAITPGQRTPVAPHPNPTLLASAQDDGHAGAVRHTHGSFAVAVRHWRDALQPPRRLDAVRDPAVAHPRLLNIVMVLETGG